MKTLFQVCFKTAVSVILLLYFSSGLLAQQCTYTWAPQTSGTTSTFYSVKAVNELICWTAGMGGTIRRTSDGGVTWVDGNPNPGVITGNILNIDAVDANNAWCTTSPSINTFIYKTTNGGNSWVQVYSQTGGFINGINMISASTGFAFGDPVASVWNILITANGGSNWLPLPTAPGATVGEAGFENSFQVSLPYMWFGAFLGSVYRTTNNGINWTSHNTPGLLGYVFSVHFNSQSLGLASALTMVRSTDAGSTYLQLPVLGLGNINGIEGSGNEFWYIRGENIYRSTNGGNNWALAHVASTTQLGIDFPNNISGCLAGWSVGVAGTITKMTGVPVGLGSNNGELALSYNLEQNNPNPFNPVTNISFAIPKPGFVDLRVYDALGRESAVLVSAYKPAGNHTVQFDASGLASGLYFYTLNTGDYINTKKMLLLK